MFTRQLLRISTLFIALSLVACGSGEEERPPALSFAPTQEQLDDGDPCTPPDEGCPCEEVGAESDCGTIVRHSADYITCSYGVMTCGEDFAWSACIGDEVSVLPIPETGAR